VALVVDLDLGAEVPADHEVRAITAVVGKLDLRELYADVRAAAKSPAQRISVAEDLERQDLHPEEALQLDQRGRDLGRPQGGLMDGSAQLTASARRHASHRPQPSARATAAVPESMLDGVFRNGSRRRSRQGWSRDTDFADASSEFTVLRIGSPKIHRISENRGLGAGIWTVRRWDVCRRADAASLALPSTGHPAISRGPVTTNAARHPRRQAAGAGRHAKG